MDSQGDATIAELRSEARNLQYLLQNYLDDKTFTSQDPPGQLLYFIDSHEIRSYIAPSDQLTGFILLAESAMRSRLARPVREAFELDQRLKSEQILHELLFHQAQQTGILPSHAEEIDEEIAYQQAHWTREQISLLSHARDQVRRLLFLLRAPERELRAAETDPTKKRRFVNFFRQAAPALMALIHNNADNTMSRIDALVRQGNLAPLDSLAWSKFGYEEAICEQLRELKPSPEKVARWRGILAEDRENTYRSNRIDAEALAYLEDLNLRLSQHAPRGPKVRAVLITRAMTLIHVARRNGVNFIRHPRLLLLNADIKRSDSARRSEQTLFVSLRTYHQQLKGVKREPLNESEQGLNHLVDTLVNTWAEFESSRLTIELRSQAESAPSISDNAAVDADFRSLLEWLRVDADVEKLLNDEVQKAIRQFGQATFALGRSLTNEPVRARVSLLSAPPRSRVMPMVSGSPLPVEFLAESLRKYDGSTEDLVPLLSDLRSNPAERYLAWSTLSACQKRWKLAEIYANSALDIAKLKVVSANEAQYATHEALLLRAQISRLGSGENEGKQAKEARARYEWCERALARTTRSEDPRVPFERAAQLLEFRLLVIDPQPDIPSLAFGFAELTTGLELSSHDEFMQARILGLGVCFYACARVRPDMWPELTSEECVILAGWHKQLHNLLNQQRISAPRDKVSVRSRGAELLGFQVFVRDDVHSSLHKSVRRAANPVRIPAELRLDVFEVRDRLSISKDAVAKFIFNEMKLLGEKLDTYRQRDLTYAPIWAPYEDGRIVEIINDPKGKIFVRSAYDLLREIAGASQRFGVQPHDREKLNLIIEKLDNCRNMLCNSSEDFQNNRHACFYVWMESCYARLLLAQIAWPYQETLELKELVDQYRQIVQRFPEASIPHFRLDVILAKLGSQSNDDSFAEARLALEKVDNDPLLGTPQHWVKSTMKRRVAGRYIKRARKIGEECGRDPSGDGLPAEYLNVLFEAFRLLYSGYSDEIKCRTDDLYRLEARRRINNIVYCASLILEQPPGERRMQDMNFTGDELRKMTELLHESGIEAIPESYVAHTVGCAYAVLGDTERARAAGSRLLVIIGESGGDPVNDKEVAVLVGDALRWFPHHAGEEVVFLEGALQRS